MLVNLRKGNSRFYGGMRHALGIFVGGGYAAGTESRPTETAFLPLRIIVRHRGIDFLPLGIIMRHKEIALRPLGIILRHKGVALRPR